MLHKLLLQAFILILTIVGGVVRAEDPAKQSPISFNIPAQNLDDALKEFAKAADVQLVYSAETVATYQSRKIDGSFKRDDALRLLLGDAQIEFSYTNKNTIALKVGKPSSSLGTPQLPEVIVEGDKKKVDILPSPSRITPQNSILLSDSNVATRINASVLETPASISTVTEKMLDDRHITRADKSLVFVPGVSFTGTDSGGAADEIAIRGFNSNRTVFTDGYRNTGRFVKKNIATTERIDILKGSSGVLYGTAFPGGLVNFVTKTPKPVAAYSGYLEGGSYDTFGGEFDATGAITKNKELMYRFITAGKITSSTNNGNKHVTAPDDSAIIAPSIRWITPGGGTLDVRTEATFENHPFNLGIVYTQGKFLYNGRPQQAKDASNIYYNLRNTAELRQPITENWDVMVGYNRLDFNGDSDEKFAFGPDTVIGGGNLDYFRDRSKDQTRANQVRVEISGKAELADWFEIKPLFGFDFYNQEQRRFQPQGAFSEGAIDPQTMILSPKPDLGAVGPDRYFNTEQIAYYFQGYTTIHKQFHLLTGVRYLDYSRQINFANRPHGKELGDDAIDFTVSGIYNFADWFAPFAGYSTATDPQFVTLADGGVSPPKKSRQMEAGVKSAHFNKKFLAQLSVFKIDQDDVVETIPGTNPPVARLVGSQRSQGFELEFTGKVLDRINLQGGYAYTDAYVSKSVGSNGGIPLEGKQLTSIPLHQLSLWVQYEFSEREASWLKGLSINSGATYIAGRYGDNVNRFVLPDYVKWDIGARYEWKFMNASLNVENLLNENYVSGSSDASIIYQGTKRSVNLRVGFKF